MTTTLRPRNRRDRPSGRATISVYLDADVNAAILELVRLRVVPNRSAAVEDGLRILIEMHADKLRDVA